MKRRYLVALGLAAAVIAVGMMPYSHVTSTSSFASGTALRPFAGAPASGQPAPVSLAIVRTSAKPVREAMIVSGGSWSRDVTVSMSGFVIRHGDKVLAFDLGLGSGIDAQYDAEMPMWARPTFGYARPVDPLAAQFVRAGQPLPEEVVLSHSHWDHGSGLEDFPQAQVWVSGAEMAFIRTPQSGAGRPWMSQVGRPDIRWQTLAFPDGPFLGFSASNDIFGDGSVVALPIPGHTPGSLALFIRTASGRRFLLVGDVLWNAGELRAGQGKAWPARALVDGDQAATARAVRQLMQLSRADPGLTIVPAHDGDLQARLGLFPRWID